MNAASEQARAAAGAIHPSADGAHAGGDPSSTPSFLWPHRWPIRVYYEDTDAQGLVYYANYLRYLERARSEMLRAAAIDQTTLRAEAGVFVVRRCEIDYRAPAKFDDLLEVVTRPLRVGGASLDLAQDVTRDGASMTTALVKLAFIDAAGRPARLPMAVKTALAGGAAQAPTASSAQGAERDV